DRRGRGSAKETDSRQVPRLLRTRRKRTRDYRAPQQGDELAPPNAGHGDFLPCRVKTFGLPRTQPAAERAATPWARPESFSIETLHTVPGLKPIPLLRSPCSPARALS